MTVQTFGSLCKIFSSCYLLSGDSTLEIPSSSTATETLYTPPSPPYSLCSWWRYEYSTLSHCDWEKATGSVSLAKEVEDKAYPKFRFSDVLIITVPVTGMMNSKLPWSNSFLQILKKPQENNAPKSLISSWFYEACYFQEDLFFPIPVKNKTLKNSASSPSLLLQSNSWCWHQALTDLPVVVSDGTNPPQTIGAALIRQQTVWQHIRKNEQFFVLDIEHSSETFGLSKCDKRPHRRLRSLLNSLAASKRAFWDNLGSRFPVENPGQESHWSEREAGFNLFFLPALHKRTFPLHPSLLCPFNLTCWRGAKEHNKKKLDFIWEAMTHLQMKCCMYCGSQEGQHRFHKWRVHATPQHSYSNSRKRCAGKSVLTHTTKSSSVAQ